MKFPRKPNLKPATIVPMDRATFRKQFWLFLAFQLVTITFSMILYSAGHRLGRSDIQVCSLILLLIIQIAFSWFLQTRKAPQRRLVNIYPNLSSPNPFFFTLYWMTPLVSLALLLFLFFAKEKPTGNPAPIVFRRSGLTAVFVVLLTLSPVAFQIGNLEEGSFSWPSRVSYWLSNPTIYYITRLLDQVSVTLQAKEKISTHNHVSPLSNFKAFADTHNLSVTGIVLMASALVTYHVEERKLEPTDETSKTNRQLSLLEDMISIIELWDRNPPAPALFNPISILSPIGAIEIALISGIDLRTKLRIQQKLLTKMKDMTQALSQEIHDKFHSHPQKTRLIEKIQDLRRRLEMTHMYRVIFQDHLPN